MSKKLEDYIERYGEPVLRFETGVSGEAQIFGDVPDECCVFCIDHPTEVMAVSRRGDDWEANYGDRTVIKELLGRLGFLRSSQDRCKHVDDCPDVEPQCYKRDWCDCFEREEE